MKSIGAAYLLCILLISIGIILLIKAIRILRKSFSGEIVVEIPFSQKITEFEITRSGVYAIWQKGPYIRKMPVDQFKPILKDISTNQEINLTKPLFRPNAKNLNTVKMEIYRFNAEVGRYRLELAPGSSISSLEKIVSSLVPARKALLNQYFLMVRESYPLVKTLSGIIMLVFAGFIMIGGIVFALLQKP